MIRKCENIIAFMGDMNFGFCVLLLLGNMKKRIFSKVFHTVFGLVVFCCVVLVVVFLLKKVFLWLFLFLCCCSLCFCKMVEEF